ncbi:serine/threonine protein kinase, partial [Streptomyces sp. HSW2009]
PPPPGRGGRRPRAHPRGAAAAADPPRGAAGDPAPDTGAAPDTDSGADPDTDQRSGDDRSGPAVDTAPQREEHRR